MKAAFWTLFGVTLALYAAMLVWTLPHIAAAAGGLAPFDLRPAGYSFDEARAFLAALTPEGAAFYRAPQHVIDLAYPPLMSLTVFFAIAWLARGMGTWRWLLAAIALPSAVFDLLENHAVDQMLDAGAAGLSPQLATTASAWTILKSLAYTASLTILLLLLAWAGWTAWRRRRARA